MIDRSAEVAAHLVESNVDVMDPVGTLCAITARWPDLSPAEMNRGAEIALEILASDTAEDLAACDALEIEACRQLEPDAAISDTCRSAVVRALQEWGEAEIAEAADGAGLPADVLKRIVASLRREGP